ncbi:glycine betaine ABC transporter substrate-binding protein [Paraburkholderia agricolaris]|uniref:glycine betaine ABC transporter substrate-binding protein n=1 Tax=Paraburkholderia agricolaris TaxID=2152888 RepID=UPI0038B9FF6D
MHAISTPRLRTTVKCLIGTLSLMCVASLTSHAAVPETATPITVPFINSSDSDFINAVYGEALKKLGYKVKYVTVDSAAQYTAVQTGDLAVSLGAWQTTGVEMTKAALDSGKVQNFGPTGVKVTEGWWFPDYVIQACPKLPSYEALKDPACVKALATADTAPKGRYVDAPADWGTRSDERIKKLQLPFALINSGSPAALLATFQGAIDRKQPILGWMYTPNWFTKKNPGQFVRFPDSRPEVDVLKLANKQEIAQVPVAARVLQHLTLNKEDVAVAMDHIDNGGSSPEKEADAWLDKHADAWSAWAK